MAKRKTKKLAPSVKATPKVEVEPFKPTAWISDTPLEEACPTQVKYRDTTDRKDIPLMRVRITEHGLETEVNLVHDVESIVRVLSHVGLPSQDQLNPEKVLRLYAECVRQHGDSATELGGSADLSYWRRMLFTALFYDDLPE